MMRQAVMAALIAIVTIGWPAYAQEVPPERVLVDATLYVRPPGAEGLCMVVDAGQLTVTVRRTREAIEGRPARFALYGFMADPDAHIETPIGNQEISISVHVNGADRYCWSIEVDAPETERMANAQRGAFVQRIAVKITHRLD